MLDEKVDLGRKFLGVRANELGIEWVYPGTVASAAPGFSTPPLPSGP